jgi:hypothetical protein
MTTSLRAALFDEPLQIALDQPHQIAISAGSVAMMAGFAGSVGIVHPLVGLIIAIGVEWAWLKGVASDVARPSRWGVTLNASAFLLAATWGVLWCAKLLKAFEPTDYGWLLAFVHVVPVVWLSLCSAMCHRIKIQEDYKAVQARETERNALELERARKLMEVEVWKAGRAAVLEMQGASAPAQNAPAPHSGAVDASPKVHRCASCGAALTMKQYAASRRWGHCRQCKATHE